MDPDCEVNEKNIKEKNDGNDVLEEGTNPQLELDTDEIIIEADEKTLIYAEEELEDHEQREVPKNMEPVLLFFIRTRQNEREKFAKKCNPYRDVFIVDGIDLKRLAEDLVGLEELTASQEVNNESLDDRSKPELKIDDKPLFIPTSNLNLTTEYSSSVILTDSNFKPMDKTSEIAVRAE